MDRNNKIISIRTSNRKVLGSTPDRSTRIFFPSMPVSLSRIIHHSHSFTMLEIYHHIYFKIFLLFLFSSLPFLCKLCEQMFFCFVHQQCKPPINYEIYLFNHCSHYRFICSQFSHWRCRCSRSRWRR